MNPAEAYIMRQPEPFRSLLIHIQFLIEREVPTAKLLYKYNIPFFYIEGKLPFVYLNFSKTYVDVGFTRGAHLTQHLDHLIGKNRKHMKSLRYFSMDDLDEVVFTEVLLEAFVLRNKKVGGSIVQ